MIKIIRKLMQVHLNESTKTQKLINQALSGFFPLTPHSQNLFSFQKYLSQT